MSRSRVRPGRSLASCALVLAVACAACSSAPAGDARPSRAAAPASSAGSQDGAGSGSPRPAPRSCPARVYGRMTEAQRVGQLFIVGLPRDRLSAATARAITG
ncbi:MAG: hypothetical protein J2P35_21275, partial [Actinobacteria bacterium]|nr:hypothetical protein [Actinomycetota bacterium]